MTRFYEAQRAGRKDPPELAALRDAIAQQQKKIAALPITTVPVLRELEGPARRVTHVLRRIDGRWWLVHRHADFPPADQRPNR